MLHLHSTIPSNYYTINYTTLQGWDHKEQETMTTHRKPRHLVNRTMISYDRKIVNCVLPLCVICCTSPLLYFCTVLHNCSNARVRYKISCWYSFICKQGLQLIFKPNSINCFVLARNTASMLQIRNATYQNVPKSLNYTLQYFVSSSSMLKLQQFPTF